MEGLLEFLEPLLWLISSVVAIILFFLFVVQPLLRYLFVNYEIERHKKRNAEVMGMDLVGESGEDLDPTHTQAAADEALPGPRGSAKETISRLAESDPEKAGDLVKQWVHND